MTTVTGDIAVNFQALDDANPWTDADYAVISSGGTNSFQVLSGVLLPNGSGPTVFRYIGGAPTGVISAKAELNRDSTLYNDQAGPVIMDASGNGYYIRVNGPACTIRRFDAFVDSGGSVVNPGNQTFSALSTFELTLDPSTGDLEIFLNGVSIGTGNDTTYDTGLAAGAYKVDDNNNAGGIVSFAADGYAAAPTVTEGLPSSTLRVNGTPIASTTVTRIVTLAGTEVFNGSVSTNASGVLPALDLSATAVEVDDVLVDRFEFTGSAPYRNAIEFTVLAEDIAE